MRQSEKGERKSPTKASIRIESLSTTTKGINIYIQNRNIKKRAACRTKGGLGRYRVGREGQTYFKKGKAGDKGVELPSPFPRGACRKGP